MTTTRLARSTIAALAGAIVTLAQLNLPSKPFWDGLSALLYISVVTVALFVVYEAVLSCDQALQVRRIREYETTMAHALSAAVRLVVEEFGVAWDQVAVYHYQSRWTWRGKRLGRVTAVRAGAPVTEAPLRLRLGQGVPGSAFMTQELIAEEWRDFAQQAVIAGRAAWDARPSDQRYGLNWGELNNSERPEGQVSNPQFDNAGKPVGCTVVSGPLKPADLTSQQMRRILSDLATTMKQTGPAPRGWWTYCDR